MKLPRKLKKALKKAINRETDNSWDTREIKIKSVCRVGSVPIKQRSMHTTAKGYAVLECRLSPK